jgi:hypothetical protein
MAAQAVCSADPCESNVLPGHVHGNGKLKSKGSGNLRTAVQLPEGEDLSEWIAVHGKSAYGESY